MFRTGLGRGLDGRYAVLVSALAFVACRTVYRAPEVHEPHATVKLRRVYESRPGTQLLESVWVGEGQALHRRSSTKLVEAPQIDVVRVAPGPTQLRFQVGFSHKESRLVSESYTESVPYTDTETYTCGHGTHLRTCTRTVTRYRQETRWRNVRRRVDVSDGACSEALPLQPAAGEVYLVELTYRDHDTCRLSCYRQLPGPREDRFHQAPCDEPPEDLRSDSEQPRRKTVYLRSPAPAH